MVLWRFTCSCLFSTWLVNILWETGNGKVDCVNKAKRTGYIRTATIKCAWKYLWHACVWEKKNGIRKHSVEYGGGHLPSILWSVLWDLYSQTCWSWVHFYLISGLMTFLPLLSSFPLPSGSLYSPHSPPTNPCLFLCLTIEIVRIACDSFIAFSPLTVLGA